MQQRRATYVAFAPPLQASYLQMDVCKVLAKSLVQSKRAKTRIHTSKAQINSVVMEIQNQHSL
jgi:hypothetical protein